MNRWAIAFWLTAGLLTAIVLLPQVYGIPIESEGVSLQAFLETRPVNLVHDRNLLLSGGRYVLLVVCLFLMVRFQSAASYWESNQDIRWAKTGVVKVYGDPPWSQAKTALVVIVALAVTLLIAAVISNGVGLAVFTILLFVSNGGTGFRLIVDDVGVDWNGFLFTWESVESWTIRPVVYRDEDNSLHETQYLSVRLRGGKVFECKDSHGTFARPFHDRLPKRFRKPDSKKSE